MVGQYNSNLTARVTALPENTNTTANVNLLNIDPMADPEEGKE